MYCNPSTEKLFGYTKKQLLNKNIKILMTKKDAKKHNSYLSNYLNHGVAQIIGNLLLLYFIIIIIVKK